MSILEQQVTSVNDGYRWAGEPSRTFSYAEHDGPSGARAAALAYAQHVVAQREASAGRKLTNQEHLHGIALTDRPDTRTIQQRAEDENWQAPVTKKQGGKWDRFIDPPHQDTFSKPLGELNKMTLQQRLAYFAKERQDAESGEREVAEALAERQLKPTVAEILEEVAALKGAARFDGKVTVSEMLALERAAETASHPDGDLAAAKALVASAKAVRKARIQAEFDAEATAFNDMQGKLATLRTQLTEATE